MSRDDHHQPTSPQTRFPGEPFETWEYRAGLPQLGEKLFDRYEVFGVRQGGFSVVYFVNDLQTHQDYALKTCKPEFADRYATIEQFKEEAEFWLGLDPHPNIVRAYSVGVWRDQPYLFIEYVTSGTRTSLRDWLRAGTLGISQGMELTYQVCLGLESANKHGEIVHGDLKPENLLIDQRRVAKVTDFGLSRHVKVHQGAYPRLDAGTWAYAAPEVFQNQAVSSRSDTFSLGVILYEMLTGRLPYPFELSSNPREQFRQLSEFHGSQPGGGGMRDITSHIYYSGIEGVSPRVNNNLNPINSIVSTCLQSYPGERYRDFTHMRETLEYTFQIKPADPSAQVSDTDLHQRALSFYKIGQYSEALSLYNDLLRRHADDWRIWLAAADALQAVGLSDEADNFRARARRLNPQLAHHPHTSEQ